MTFLTAQKISDITMSVIFMTSFLTIFYFAYVVKIENDIVKEQIDFLTKNFVSEISIFDNVTDKLKDGFDSLKPPNLSKQNKEVADSNKKIYDNVIKYVAIVNVLGLASIYYLSKKYNFNMFNMVKHNIIVLCFIALTEYSFLNFYVKKFISVDTNHIKYNILNKIFN